MFMTAWAFEARHCPTLLNEIKKTKLQINTEPQAGINILLAAVSYSITRRLSFLSTLSHSLLSTFQCPSWKTRASVGMSALLNLIS